MSKGDLHCLLDFLKPNVNGWVFRDCHRLGPRNVLAFSREHSVDLVSLLFKLSGGNSCKHFWEMSLDHPDLFGVSNDLKEILITNEVESGE